MQPQPVPPEHPLSPQQRAAIRQQVRSGPPLTPEQRQRLADTLAQAHLGGEDQ